MVSTKTYTRSAVRSYAHNVGERIRHGFNILSTNPIFYAEMREGVLTDTKGESGGLSLRNGRCGTVTTTSEFLFSGLSGSETVVSSGGTAIPSVAAGKIVFTAGAGTVYNIRLSNGWIIPVSAGAGTNLYTYKLDGTNVIGKISVADIAAFWAGTQDEYFHDWEYGFSTGIDSAINRIVNGTFVSDTSWAKGAGWTIAGGKASRTATGTYSEITQLGNLVVGEADTVHFTVSDCTGGGVRPKLGTASIGSYLGNGAHSVSGTTTGTTSFAIVADPAFVGSVTDIRVNEIPLGRVPINPYTGLSVLAQSATTPAHSMESYDLSLVSATAALQAADNEILAGTGGRFLFEADGTTPAVWNVADITDGIINNQLFYGRNMIGIWSASQDDPALFRIISWFGIQ